MTKIIPLSAVVLGCILLTHAEPPVNRYSMTGDNNGYEFNNNVISGSYLSGKDSHSQNSFNGFSPSSHHSTFQAYSGGVRDNFGTSPYFMNDPAQSSFESYMNSNNGDTSFEGYTQSTDQAGSDFSQFSSNKHKNSMFTKYSDSLPGASSVGSFSDIVPESSSFREFSGDAFKGHLSGGYIEGDQAYNREPSVFSGSANDYSFGKHKESIFGSGSSNKYVNDMFSPHSDTRYMRGSHGSMGRDYGSPIYLTNSASSHLSNLRGSSGLYSPGKYSKSNKYSADYTPSTGLNYLSKDQDTDYLIGAYGKGGKIAGLKDSRPSSYSSQAYVGGPSYTNKIPASYKSKLNIMNYSNSPPIGYPSMSSLHSSANSYADGPMLRRYRSSSGYVPGHSSIYSSFF
ncbi:uncharacterized protein LOC143177276 [Calliopsis andreniformis]|uniref:uncharacterized protein LOC143177276 n=1 Tax=Calliopsis andreniformis TaxID=337506 RepID=UPI003FCC290B